MATSSEMETGPMAGKSRQPSNEPQHGRRKAGTHHTDKTVERQGGTGEGDSLQGVPTLRRKANAKKTLTQNANKPLQSWRMCISNKLLTVRVKLVLLVVNSVKLHLTALNYFQQMHLVGAPVSCITEQFQKISTLSQQKGLEFPWGVGVLEDQKC